MRVLIISLEYSSTVGGVGTHVQELSTGLAAAGDLVTVLSGTVGQARRFDEGKKTVHLVSPDDQKPGRSIVQGILDYNCTLARYAHKTILNSDDPPELVHCHNWITYPAAVEIARTLKIPVITTIHYVSHPIEQWWGQEPDPEILKQEENLFHKGNIFIAVSQSMRSLMRDFYSVPEQRVRVIYNAVDSKSFLPSSVSAEYIARLKSAVSPANEKIVLFTGRLHPMKGIPALLKSAEIVLEKEPNIRYLIAGEPDSKAFAHEFREQLERSPILKEKIVLLGKVSRKRVALLYSLADVAILPSVYDPCPYAAIETMAAGVPLVASDGGGLAELVEDGVTGIKIPVRVNKAGMRSVDPEELAEATLRVLQDKSLAERMGKSARQKADETFSPGVMVRATQEVYQTTIEQTTVEGARRHHA